MFHQDLGQTMVLEEDTTSERSKELQNDLLITTHSLSRKGWITEMHSSGDSGPVSRVCTIFRLLKTVILINVEGLASFPFTWQLLFMGMLPSS